MLIIMEEQCFNVTGNDNEKSAAATTVTLNGSTFLLEMQKKNDGNDTSNVKRKRIKPIRLDSDESECENSHSHVFCKTDDSLVISPVSQATSVLTNDNSDKIKSTSDLRISDTVVSKTHTPALTDNEDKELKLARNLKSTGKKRLLFLGGDDSDDESKSVDLKSSDDLRKRLGVAFIDSDGSDNESKSIDNLKDRTIGRKRFDLSAFASSDDSDNESQLINKSKTSKSTGSKRFGLSAVIDSDDSGDDVGNVKTVNSHSKKISRLSVDSDDSNYGNYEREEHNAKNDGKSETVPNVNFVEGMDTANEVRKQINLNDNDLYSRDDSSCDENSPAEEPENISPKIQMKKSKPSSSKDELKKIHSESQRMLRESRVSLPYHRPKQHSLAEFLQRRKSSVVSVKDVGTLWNHIKEREKEAVDFFKSDSESSDDEAKCDNEDTLTKKDDMKALKENNWDNSLKCNSRNVDYNVASDNVDNSVPEASSSTNDLVFVLSAVSKSVNDPSCLKECSSKTFEESSEKSDVENFSSSAKCIETLSNLSTLILSSENTEKMDNDASISSFEKSKKNSDTFTLSIDNSGNNPKNLSSEKREKLATDAFINSFGKSVKNSETFTLSIDNSGNSPQTLSSEKRKKVDTDAFLSSFSKSIENSDTFTLSIDNSGNSPQNLSSKNSERVDTDAFINSFGKSVKNSDTFTLSIDSSNITQEFLSENTEQMVTDDFPSSFGKSTKNSDTFTLSLDSSSNINTASLKSSGLSKNNPEILPPVIDLQDSEAVDIDFVESLKKRDDIISQQVDSESVNSIVFSYNGIKPQSNFDKSVGSIKFFENIKEKLDNVETVNSIQSIPDDQAYCMFPSQATIDADDISSNSKLTLSLKSLIPLKINMDGENILENKLKKWGNFQEQNDEPINSDTNCEMKNNDMSEDMSINFLVTAKIDSQDLCLDYTESEDINNTTTVEENHLPQNADVSLSHKETCDNNKKIDETNKKTGSAEDTLDLGKNTPGLQNSDDKGDESVKSKEEYKLPFVPLSSDSETDDMPKTKIKKLFKLDDNISKFKPRLSGASEGIIDLYETPKTRPRGGVESLINRFMKHVSSKKRPPPKETEISVISAEKGADDIEIVKKDIVKVTLGNESLLDEPDHYKPGYKHRRFREELRQQLALQRGQEWSKKLQEVKIDEEEIEEDDIYKKDKIEENTDESDTEEEEEEEEEDDIAVTDRKREKNAFLDDEAEEEDDGDMADVSSDEEEEDEREKVCNKDKDRRLSTLDTDIDEDEGEEADEKECREETNSSSKEDGKSKYRFQRVKTLDDSDSDEDAFTIPVYQPQGGCKNVGLLMNASPNLTSPDVSIQSSLCKWPSSLKKTFESPSTTTSALSVSPKDSSSFLGKSLSLISPKKLFSDASISLDIANDFCLASRTNSDLDLEAELMELCSGNFETQPVVSEDTTDKKCDKISLQSYPESSEDLVKFSLFDDSASLGVAKMFPSLMQMNSETQKQKKDRTVSRMVIESESDSEDQEKNNSKVKKKKNISKKLAFSDDEESVEVNSDLEDNESQTSFEDNTGKQEGVDLENYDSEENEVEEAPTKPVDFFENEAELSESEWGSEDEDEKGLDSLESEAGDDEDLDQKQLEEQLGKIHMRRILDDDKREVRLLQELLLEDGELHSEGSGRERKFRWRNTDTWEDNDKRNSGDESPGNNDEEEDEEEWRRMRREREKFFQEQKMNSQDVDPTDNLAVEKNAGKVLKLGMAAIRRSISMNTQELVIEKQTTVLQRTNSEPLSSPQPKHPLTIRAQRGSFLARGESALARLAEISYGGPDSNLAGPKNSRNFVFAAVSPVKEVTVEKETTEKMVVKRKLPNATPPVTKKLKILDEKKMNRQRFFDSLLI